MRWLVLVTAALVAGRASADDRSEHAAALFEAGQQLATAGHIDEACDKFAASLELDPTLGTKLNLADCRERQGKLVEAYHLYEDAAEQAAHTGKSGRGTFARERLASLAQRLAVVHIRLAEPDRAGQEVRIEAPPVPLQRIATNEWTKPRVVDPGQITVEVVAPERVPYRVVKYARPGESVVFDVPPLHTGAIVQQSARSSRVPWIAAGAGGASLILSALLALHAEARYYRARAEGGAGLASRIDGAQLEADVATVFAIGGGLAIAAGLGLYLHDRRQRDRIAVIPSTSARGIAIIARW